MVFVFRIHGHQTKGFADELPFTHAVHEALDRLAKINPRYEKLVEARYFAGLSNDEAAEALAVSRATVVRDWRAVRTWLYAELQRQPQA